MLSGEIQTQNQTVPYFVNVSHRARRMRISVNSDSSVVVTLPWGASISGAEKFLRQKFSWVLKILQYFTNHPPSVHAKIGRRDYLKQRTLARSLAKNKVEQWNKFYGFHYGRISIKNQKTRWGSCSKQGNLNFNYKIVYLPEALLDYLVVHELCHLKELNHSRSFWHLVSQTIPAYKKLRAELKSFNIQKI